jgi:hypothetical protein
VYPHYVAKAERKGRTQDEVDQVICWLAGFDEATLQRHLAQETTFEEFFARAHLNPTHPSSPVSCAGCASSRSRDPLMQKIRYLDTLVDELAKGKAMDKILRTAPAASR